MKPGFLDTLTTRVESLERRVTELQGQIFAMNAVLKTDIHAGNPSCGDSSTESTDRCRRTVSRVLERYLPRDRALTSQDVADHQASIDEIMACFDNENESSKAVETKTGGLESFLLMERIAVATFVEDSLSCDVDQAALVQLGVDIRAGNFHRDSKVDSQDGGGS